MDRIPSTTADLPDTFLFIPADPAVIEAVARTGLRASCVHGVSCATCALAAAREVVAAAG